MKAKILSIVELVEKGFVVLSVLIFTEAIIPTLQEVEDSILKPEILRIFVPSAILVGTILLLIIWHRRVFDLARREKFLWVVVAIALASVFWSYAPATTLRRLLVFINATLFGTYFAARYSHKEQLRLLAWAFGIAAVLSLVLIMMLPEYGVMGIGSSLVGESQEINHQGAWRGVYIHKNIFGINMALSGLIFYFLAKSSRHFRLVAWAGLSLSIILVIGSTSKLALLVGLVAIAFWLIYQILRWSLTTELRWRHTLDFPYFVALFIGNLVVAIALIAIFNIEAILELVGRDLTLSSRTELWTNILTTLWDRPWLGYGYGGFWLAGDASREIRNLFGDWAAHSHNGFIDLWLDLGLLGLSAFIYSFITACFGAFAWAWQQRTTLSCWFLAYLIFLLLINVSESALLSPQSAGFWLLYVAGSLSLHKSTTTTANVFLPETKLTRSRQLS